MSITLKNQSALSQDQEADLLISALHVWGIDYLIASSQNAAMKRAASRLAPVELIKRLARCELPRVRDASISLFLLHPELADAAHEAYKTSEPSESEQIAILILATLYLQRLWSFRLRFAFRRVPHFTEERFAHLWQERALPAPHCQYGRAGLEALQAREQQRRGLPVNFIEDWQNQIEHLLKQEESKHHSAAKFTGLAVLQGEEEQIEFASPADFIPIPSQWTAHAKFIGRYGKIDAFYFDLYSLALSKISRSSDRDLVDVKLLVQQKLITLDELDAAYQEVLPRMGKRPYINLDPEKFAERYRIVRQQL